MQNIAKYLYEIGQLKQVKRSGWWLAGIRDPESVAEHSFRTAILGYIIASLEGADPLKTAGICLFHDTHEARISDLHRVTKRYIKHREGERQAIKEQIDRLPPQIAEEVISFNDDYADRNSLEARIAHDADSLECLIQAREYQVQGYADVQDWITNCQAALKTESAKNIAEECLQVEPSAWWEGLKKATEL
jgi:putative hydrolase of HD superfamily